MTEIESIVFDKDNKYSFEEKALLVYEYQSKHCKIYSEYVKLLNQPKPTNIKQIPFLPIEFFKTKKIISTEKFSKVFKSSGTGGIRSTHYVSDLSIYERVFNQIYKEELGDTKNQLILALLPNYLEQGESSLVYMVDHLIESSRNNGSKFILEDLNQIEKIYKSAREKGLDVIIFGVTYALLDLADMNIDLEFATIIETGGMKGRRKELSKSEIHSILRKGLKTHKIFSEYGMTELLSQSYSKSNQWFSENDYLKVLIRQVNDPFEFEKDGKTGGVNIIDLGNIYSCSFIATQDLGKKEKDQFQILGRFDNSDIRGCNLLVNK